MMMNKNTDKINEVFRNFDLILEKGKEHWVIMYSGGKDSTALLTLVSEYLQRNKEKLPEVVDVIYSDTLLEIPPLKDFSLKFLKYIKAKVPDIDIHIVTPKETFWINLIGKGYPPPHQRFRWCTRRLKIEPAKSVLSKIKSKERTVIMTGVRFNESKNRDLSLYRACKRGGECGSALWYHQSSKNGVSYLAPIINWTGCHVWEFLLFTAPSLGYPTKELSEIYNGRETRFGCWMCTVVRQDRAMEKITSQPKWAHLRPLLEFRNWVMELCSNHKSRVIRPDGKPGRLKISIRKQILSKLLELQKRVGIPLITSQEIKTIKNYWTNPKYGSRY